MSPVADLHHQMGKGRTAASGDSYLVTVLDGDDRRRLGQAVGRRHPTSETLLECIPYRLGKVGPAGPRVGQRRADPRRRLASAAGEALQNRGNAEPGVHRFVLDPGCDADRIDPVHHDLRAAGLGHEQRARDLHVEDGQCGAVTLPQLRPEVPCLHQHRPGQEQIPVGVHDALGSTGGAARVGDPSRIRRAAVGSPVAGLDCCRPSPARTRRPSSDNDDRRYRRAVSRRRSAVGTTSGEARRRRASASPRMKSLLGRRQVAIDAEPDGTQARHCVERDHDVARVGQADGNDVVLLDPHGRRVRRPLVRPPDRAPRRSAGRPRTPGPRGAGSVCQRPLEHMPTDVGIRPGAGTRSPSHAPPLGEDECRYGRSITLLNGKS